MLLTFVFGEGSLTSTEIYQFDQPGREKAQDPLLFLSLVVGSDIQAAVSALLSGGWEPDYVLMFLWQVLYQLSNLQILQNFLLIPFINACSLMTPLHAESDGDIWHTRRLILFTSKYPSLTCESLIRLLEMLVRTPGMLIPCLSYANGNQMLPSVCPVEPDVT